MASLRHAWVAKSSASSMPSISAAIARAAGSSGNVSRTSPRTRTWPGADASDRYPHDRRQHRRAAHVRADQLALLDPVLEHDDDRPVTAQRAQERRRALGLVGLDGDQHDVRGPRHGAGIGEHRAGDDLGAAALALDDEPLVRRAPAQQRSAPARRTAAATVAPMAPGPTTATRVTQRRSRPRRPGPAGRAARRGGPRPARRSCSRRRSAGSAGPRACPSPARTRRRPDSARRGRAAR